MQYVLTDDDKAELAEIECDTQAARRRRRNFFAKLRQRAFRARKQAIQRLDHLKEQP